MSASHPEPEMIALGVQQPWAELIVRGVKTIEVRSQNTNRRGPILIYASKKFSALPAAKIAVRKYELDVDSLPRGVLVGTVELIDSRPCKVRDTQAACIPRSLLLDQYAWQLADSKRLATPLPVKFLPYGVWFYPFQRKHARPRSDQTR